MECDRLRLRSFVPALQNSAPGISPDLRQALAAAFCAAGQADPRQSLSARDRDHPHRQRQGQRAVLRPVFHAGCGGKVRQRLARSVQDAALRRRPSSRSRLSRLHLFRDEDVSGAVLQRLHRRRVCRRGRARAAVLSERRPIADTRDRTAARRGVRQSRLRRRGRDARAAGQSESCGCRSCRRSCDASTN